MTISNYLQQSGLAEAVSAECLQQALVFQQQLQVWMAQAKPEIQWQYQVPELGEGGACSLFGQLAEQPYDLELTLGGRNPATTRMLEQVTAVVAFYRQHSRSQWFGVYQKRRHPDGGFVLVKLAYYGAASRAEFPLTPEFAAMSNNSSVGLSGKARIINDVGSYLTTGGEYYTCDPKVQSEACLPLLDADAQVLGIVDAEAFDQHVYSEKELALLLAVVDVVAGLLATPA